MQKSEGAKVWELWRPQKEASVAGRGWEEEDVGGGVEGVS